MHRWSIGLERCSGGLRRAGGIPRRNLVRCVRQRRPIRRRGGPAIWLGHLHAPDGSFSVGLPSEPTATTGTTTSAAGPMDVHVFAAKAADQKTTYAISYSDFPAAPGRSPDPSVVLDNAVHGAVTGANATLQQSHPIDLGGVPGRDWTATSSGGPGHGRIYLSGGRLYQIIVAGSDVGLPNADEFLASFAIR